MAQKWVIFGPKMTPKWPKNGPFLDSLFDPLFTGFGQPGSDPLCRSYKMAYFDHFGQKGKKGGKKQVQFLAILDPKLAILNVKTLVSRSKKWDSRGPGFDQNGRFWGQVKRQWL